MSTATMIEEKNKFMFFEAMKDAAKKTAEATGKAAKTVYETVTSGLAAVGNGITFLGKTLVQTLKTGISLAAIGADLIINITGMVALQALHVAYKVIYGVGLVFTLPAVHVQYGTLGLLRAWQAYRAMWTRKGWKYYSAYSYYNVLADEARERTMAANDAEGLAKVYDIKTGKRIA